MIGWIAGAFKGVQIVNRVRRTIREGKDIPKAVQTMRTKYQDLPDDVQAAWREVDEFVDAFLDMFPQTRD